MKFLEPSPPSFCSFEGFLKQRHPFTKCPRDETESLCTCNYVHVWTSLFFILVDLLRSVHVPATKWQATKR